MPSTVLTTITVRLLAKDHRAFATACRLLRGTMGAKAPTVRLLIEHNLSRREAKGLAEDYLASIAWPAGPRRARITKRPLIIRPFRAFPAAHRMLPPAPDDIRRN